MRKQTTNFNQKNQTKMSNLKRFNEHLDDDFLGDDDRLVPDGVWDLEDIEVFGTERYFRQNELVNFKQRNPNYAIADCDGENILLSRMPTKKVPVRDYHGCSFEGHGSLAVIENCPTRILIIGEND